MDRGGKHEGSDTLLVINGLSGQVTREELQSAFATFGEVAWAEIVKDKFGRSLAFGYVWMRRMHDAEKARKGLHGSTLGGRPIHIETVPLVNGALPNSNH